MLFYTILIVAINSSIEICPISIEGERRGARFNEGDWA